MTKKYIKTVKVTRHPKYKNAKLIEFFATKILPKDCESLDVYVDEETGHIILVPQ